MPTIEPRSGDSRKIIGITPKFYIKDDGTDYDTGEKFNGLWSGGTISTPTGYADVGHWKLLEEAGVIAFNNRIRGLNSLFLEGIVRSSDAVGSYLSYKIPDHEPLTTPSPYHFIMMGTGGSFSKTDLFDQFLQTPSFSEDIRLMFDTWAYFRKPPQNSGDRQILFAVHCETGGSQDHILNFGVRNNAGTLEWFMEYCNGDQGGTAVVSIDSTTVADLVYPEGLGAEGGLHHVGFILDRTSLSAGDIKFGLSGDGPEGFYVDGRYIAKTAGSTATWFEGAHTSIDTNAFIGCEIDGSPNFNPTQAAGLPSFKSHLIAKIYSVSLTTQTTIGEITEARMNTLNSLGFNIPRGPSKVDFSERFEYRGQNLLQDIGTIKQVLESKRGHFHLTVSQVKVRN